MLRTASIQMVSLNNDYEANRKKAEELINSAAKEKPDIVLLPEFALIGYDYRDSAWKYAEPVNGRTYQWLRGLAAKFKFYIGTCILEKDGDDFYDTFILAGPGCSNRLSPIPVLN